MELNNRIQKIVDELYKSSRRSFAIALGVSPATIDNVLGARSSKPSADLLIKIKQKVNCINLDWLLAGDGEMLKTTEECTSDINNNEMEEAYKAAIRSMAKELKELEKENAELRARLGVKEKVTA